jgi:hypothetical protein
MGQGPDYDGLSERELLAELAADLYGGDTRDFGPSEARQRIQDAREFAERWLSRNRQALCAGLARRGFQSAETLDAIVDSATIVDAVIGLGLGHPTAAIIAALALKWGLRDLCK